MLKPIKLWAIVTAFVAVIAATGSVAQSIDEAIGTLAENLVAQLTEEGAKRLAIQGFSDLNGFESALGDFISEELVTSLIGAGDFAVVERKEFERVIQEQERYASGVFDAETISKLGQFLAIDALITGSITRFDESVKVNARAISVSTGRVFAAASVSMPRDGMVNSLLSQSSRSLQVEGSVVQSSDAVFQNGFIRVVPVGVRLAKNTSYGTEDGIAVITTEFQNLTNEPLQVAMPANNGGPDVFYFATTKNGEILSLGLKGLAYFNSPTEIPPGGTVTVVWEASSGRLGGSIQGKSLVMSANLYRYSGANYEVFRVQLDNISLR